MAKNQLLLSKHRVAADGKRQDNKSWASPGRVGVVRGVVVGGGGGVVVGVVVVVVVVVHVFCNILSSLFYVTWAQSRKEYE